MFILSFIARLLYGPDWKKYANAKPPRRTRQRGGRRRGF